MRYLIAFFVVIMALAGYQIVRIACVTQKVSYTQTPFERIRPHAKLKILFLGDSTAVGTGALNNTESVPGRFGQDFPEAHIRNISRNGRKLKDVIENFPTAEDHYDLVVIQAGSNDIMRLTPLKTVEKNLALLIDKAKLVGDRVIMLHSGDVGAAPVFSWPLNGLFSLRTRAVRQIYINAAQEKGVIYVDLYKIRTDNIFLKDTKNFYSADLLHPSGAGYGVWYEHIRFSLL